MAAAAAAAAATASAAPSQQQQGPGWFVEVTGQPLDAAKYTQLVTAPGAGAISSFVGTTRDSFQGRRVLRLEYEAYTPMALAKLKELCERVQQRWEVVAVAIAHRTGVVEVCEASVVIAVSSAHRRAALEAAAWAIDELKATVPIWKKEFFEDGSIWKENPESRALLQVAPPSDATAAAAGVS